MWWFNRSRPSGPANEAKEPDPARRRVLFGIGAAACAVAVGTLPFGGEAHAAAAASPLDDLLDRIDGVDAAAKYVPGKEDLPGSRQSGHALFKTCQCLGSGKFFVQIFPFS